MNVMVRNNGTQTKELRMGVQVRICRRDSKFAMLPAMPKLLYFAQLVDVLGLPSEDLLLEAEPISVAELSAKLAQRGCAWQRVFSDPRGLRIAVNKPFAELDTVARQGDELALVVSGGLA